MYGWTGTIVEIDLSEGNITKKPTPKKLAEEFLGGEGFGINWLYDEVPPRTDPLDPEMIFVVATGPLTGTLSPSSGRLELITKSPRTGILGDSNLGGFFAPELKRAGYDALIIRGKARSPVYISIRDDDVNIHDAAHLWGKEDRLKTGDMIRKELGDPKIQILSIGIAGENMVAFSPIFSKNRAAAMTSAGSVWGAKNLKAIAVRGSKQVRLRDRDKLKEIVKQSRQKLSSSPGYDIFCHGGTIGTVQDISELFGILPVRNFQESWLSPEEFEPISGATWLEKFHVKHHTCFNCPLHCGHTFEIKGGPYAGLRGDGIEFGCHTMFTNNLGVFEPSFGIKCTVVANELGLDTGGVGQMLAYAAELYQRGIITEADTDGLKLTWGNQEAFLELMRKIALREGFGDVLANGFEQAAEEIGKQADKYLLTIKGSPVGVDMRFGFGGPLAYITATRGADHLKGVPYAEMVEGLNPEVDAKMAQEFFGIPTMNPAVAEGKDKMVIWYENLCSVLDSLIICKFNSVYNGALGLEYGLNFEDYARMLTAATGVHYDGRRLMDIGERIYRFEMAYNAREGLRREDFKIPRRFCEDANPSGPLKGARVDKKVFEKLLDEYFTQRGFDPATALPTREGLENVDLKPVADDLEERGLLA